MTAQYDMIIRGGLIVDGTGAEPKQADVAIAQGIIQAVGQIDGQGREEIDAASLLVTPGFIDLHTHYDGQAIWSQRLNPSSSHGVSTVILGNCGVGFAPCRPADRDLLCSTMEGVEDIPGVVMKEGLTWQWETFPEYLDVLASRHRDDGKGMRLVAFGNWPGDTLDHMFEFFDDPWSVMGLGDGGAHYGLICDSSYPTFVLTHWTRDRKGRKLSIEKAVRAMTAHPASIAGFNDRGIIAPGYKADINVIDHERLTLHGPEIVDDLPGGGRRLDQRASGYRYMLVSGQIVTRNDRPTGILPGRLVRGAQAAPPISLAA